MAALLFGLIQTGTAHAEAIWSLAASQNGILPISSPVAPGLGAITNNANVVWAFNSFLNVGGNGYSFAGTMTETTRPFGAATLTAFIDVNITITANAGNAGLVSDVLGFYSNVFPGALPQPGYVGMIGSFNGPPGVGAAQAQLNFNGSAGIFPASEFLRTPTIINPAPGFVFNTFVGAPILVSTNQLTGLLAFTLAPGESLTLPFDFSDNVNLGSMGFVPEPSSFVLMALGVVPLAIVARSRRKRTRAPSPAEAHREE